MYGRTQRGCFVPFRVRNEMRMLRLACNERRRGALGPYAISNLIVHFVSAVAIAGPELRTRARTREASTPSTAMCVAAPTVYGVAQ
jgi:hypothetical protein